MIHLKKYILPTILICLILLVNALRFVKLDEVPPGVHPDEAGYASALVCINEDGQTVLTDQRYPLFAKHYGSPSPPTYLYLGMIWVKLFGFAPTSLRAFTVLYFIIGLIGLFMLGKHLGGVRLGLWIALAASISSWAWCISRTALEAPMIMPFLCWGLFFCLSAKNTRSLVIAGILFSLAAYCYPNLRLQMPFFLLLMAWYGTKCLQWKMSQILTLYIACFLTTVPMLIAYIYEPHMSSRMKELLITNPEHLKNMTHHGSLLDLISIFFKNFFSHLTPSYLLFKGAVNLPPMNTTKHGLMSIMDVMALVSALIWLIKTIKTKTLSIQRHHLYFALFLGLNILIAIIPTSLLKEANPNPLRTFGGWPFAMIATGYILHKLTSKVSWTKWPVVLLTILFGACYLKFYFVQYPKIAQGWYSSWTQKEAQAAKTDHQWLDFLYRYEPSVYLSQYYYMLYRNETCTNYKKMMETLAPVFQQIKRSQQTQ